MGARQRRGLAHGAQIGDEPRRLGIAHGDDIAVGRRKCEASALQQVRQILQADERSDAQAGAAGYLGFRRDQRQAQFVQRVAAEQRGEQQAIRAQAAAQLDQRAGQVVDPVQQ